VRKYSKFACLVLRFINRLGDGMMNKTVYITIEGGIIQDMNIPKGIEVVVCDYDVNVNDPTCKPITRDDYNHPYLKTVWEHED